MKAKFTIALLIVASAVFLMDAFHHKAQSNASGAPARVTGSPGDGHDCTACHYGTAQTASGWITSDIPVTGYVAGTTYTVTATATYTGRNKFGFEISPQKPSGAKVGTIIITSSQTRSPGAGYITHSSSGISGTNSKTWTFNWKAPAAGTGPFTFYGAFNAANGDGTQGGDIIYLSTLNVIEDSTDVVTGTDAINDAEQVTLYPNPADKQLFLYSRQSGKVSVNYELYNMSGQRISVPMHFNKPASLDVSQLPEGLYFLKMENGDENSSVRRILIKHQ